MKQRTLILGGLCLLLILMGCQRAPAAEAAPTETTQAPAPVATELSAPTAAPTHTPVSETVPGFDQAAEAPEDERIRGLCISILDQLPCSVDLDGDGRREVVDLVTYVPEDEYPRWAVAVQGDGWSQQAQTDIPFDMPHDLWVGDMDEDGKYELFFHGDMASDDYLIYAWRWDLTPIFFEPDERAARWGGDAESSVFAGRIEGFEDWHIVIEGVVDMLGTHWGIRNYALGEDGIIGPMATVWAFSEEADRALTVKQPLTAYTANVRKDPGEAFILAPGEKILPVASDGCERLWFETEKGKHGVLLLVPDEEHMWLIDGTPEGDFFEFLPYSG